MSTHDVQVRIQPTPNPNALKFVTNVAVKNTGKATFAKPSEATGILLAEDLFMIEGVRQLHFFENVTTVTFAEDVDVATLELEVQALLQRRLPIHDPNFLLPEERQRASRDTLPEPIQKIEKILDETVRMHLQGDGGDIEVLKYENHQLEVRYQGACGTCPSSVGGTLEAIQGILRDQFDPELVLVPV